MSMTNRLILVVALAAIAVCVGQWCLRTPADAVVIDPEVMSQSQETGAGPEREVEVAALQTAPLERDSADVRAEPLPPWSPEILDKLPTNELGLTRRERPCEDRFGLGRAQRCQA